ncbi:MAG: glycosyltransferase family 4 protein [Candidatus Pacebacteria bacterium]|nr:glycosyltransferase family 4 protein [Candidatus Paceibacterota bacterium]
MQEKSTENQGRLKHGQETISSRKILILATSYLPLIGGAELSIKYLTEHLPEFSFDLITARTNPNLSATEKIGNVSVFRVGNSYSLFDLFLPKNFLPLAIFFKARKMLSLDRYDMVYVLQASQAAGAGWLLKISGSLNQPLVVNLQEGKDFSKQSFFVRLFRKFIFSSADYFTVISSYLRDFLVSQGVSKDKIFYLPNGVDFSISPADNNLRNTLSLGDEKVIITVSRLVEKNGLSDLIRAMLFVKSNFMGKVKLLIVGDAEPKLSLEPELKKLTTELGLDSEVIFVGAIDNKEVSRYLALADVFVRPSLSEGLGVSFLEAMAVGVPVVGTKVGGIPDFITDGETGLFCLVGDSQDIGRKIVEVISNKELSDKMSKAGQEMVRNKYDWNIIAENFRNIHESVTKN